MGTWASIVADPEAGAMTSLVGGLSQNGPVKTCSYIMGILYCDLTPPTDWGSGYGYGYLRQVFSVQSNDGTLPIGTPVWVQANIQMEGVFDGNGLGSMQAVVILNKIENASWLSWSWTNGCLKWNVLQEAILPFFPNMLGYKTIGIDSSSAIDQDDDGLKEFNFSENITANVSVGNVIVVETFLKSDISLENPAELGSSEGWNGEVPEALMLNPGNVTDEGLKASIQQYGNNLKTTLITNTPGAILVPYTHSP